MALRRNRQVAFPVSVGHRLGALIGLSIARQATFPAEQHDVYEDLLSDISDQGLIDACRELARKPRANFEPAMPAVGDIRRVVSELDLQRRNRPIARALTSGGEPSFYCNRCEDNGWIVGNCPGGLMRVCGRPNKLEWADEGGPHAIAHAPCNHAHTYVRACVCDARRARKAS